MLFIFEGSSQSIAVADWDGEKERPSETSKPFISDQTNTALN